MQQIKLIRKNIDKDNSFVCYGHKVQMNLAVEHYFYGLIFVIASEQNMVLILFSQCSSNRLI